MKEHPMLMKGPLIIATLDGSKTQTRRLPTSATARVDGKHVSPKAWKALDLDWAHAQIDGRAIRLPERRCSRWHTLTPKWEVGDHLWLRETWRTMGNCFRVKYGAQIKYRADDEARWRSPRGPDGVWRNMDDSAFRKWLTGKMQKWQPSIHMPRWASRIDLEVLAVRAENIQEISEYDAWAEGIGALDDVHQDAARRVAHDGLGAADGRDYFHQLWDPINASRGFAWSTNRPVFVLTYKRIRP